MVGANGSGKTTLLRLLASVARPSAGRIAWDPVDGVVPRDEEARREVGYVAHEPLVDDELTARENLEFLLRIHGRTDVAPRAAQALRAFGIAHAADDRAGSLSRGQRQRLALARAFALGPRLLLLDEPTTALDDAGKAVLLAALREAKARTTVVCATHDPRDFADLADRTFEVREGHLHERRRGP